MFGISAPISKYYRNFWLDSIQFIFQRWYFWLNWTRPVYCTVQIWKPKFISIHSCQLQWWRYYTELFISRVLSAFNAVFLQYFSSEEKGSVYWNLLNFPIYKHGPVMLSLSASETSSTRVAQLSFFLSISQKHLVGLSLEIKGEFGIVLSILSPQNDNITMIANHPKSREEKAEKSILLQQRFIPLSELVMGPRPDEKCMPHFKNDQTLHWYYCNQW